MNDLIYILKEHLSPAEIVELLNYVLSSYYDSKEKLKEFALENNICPKCACELSINLWKEPRGEYFGFSSYEIMSEFQCECCGSIF